ncbi:MAG TPA: tetratricopeptide repeat protein [Chthoniobacteraceae bacterium]|nr:tetratricopeptide repeat protein [Chthoniobacteraceae bacterium]
MQPRRQPFAAAAILFLAALMGGCIHVKYTHAPPGTSVNEVLAKRAQPVATPTPVPEVQHVTSEERPAGQDAVTENVADDYTMGNMLMQQGKYDDAIKKFENAVKLDPTFSDAWNHLAICYQNNGQPKKAAEAFKKYKTIAEQQPSPTATQPPQ